MSGPPKAGPPPAADLPTASLPTTGLDADIRARTDAYFNRTRDIVRRFGDVDVTYAIFLRRPVIAACRLMVEWLERVAADRGAPFVIEETHEEGDWVGAGEPLLYVSGPFSQLADLETILLQKVGPASVAAHNAFQMCVALPDVPFLAMDARHCAGEEMQIQMAYAASVGSRAAQKDGARGFIGNANNATAHFFGADSGFGTMPHALIGYAGSTLRAAEMFHDTFPGQRLVILPDYFGREVSDTLEVCRRFPDLAADGRIGVRLDTHGARFLEGLDPASSYGVLERHAPGAIRRYRSQDELRHLVGTGVSAAAIWHLRDALDEAGFEKVTIAVSSGFNTAKCRVMFDASAPIDLVGTGSFIPDIWSETYATADIVAYAGEPRVKLGREFLLKRRSEANGRHG